eukprot:PhM_4_TR10172/c0_g1_i1/m.4212/K00799/GST, gst; glutathione S-transferase
MSSDNNGLVLYYHPASQPSRAVLWLLKLGNIPHTSRVVDIMKGEAESPEMLAKNPWGAVPFIEDPNLGVLTESTAILQFLCSKYSLFTFFPDNIYVRARVVEVMARHDTSARLVTTKLVRPLLELRKVNPAATLSDARKLMATGCEEHLRPVLQYINDTYYNDDVTIADLLLTCELNQLPLLGPVLPSGYGDLSMFPNIQKYLERMRAVPGHDDVLSDVKLALAGVLTDLAG